MFFLLLLFIYNAFNLNKAETLPLSTVLNIKKHEEHSVSRQIYPSKAMVISIFHRAGILALALHRQKESDMIFIPALDKRHNLMWYRLIRKIQENQDLGVVITVWKKFL